jgi:hypothetical protein
LEYKPEIASDDLIIVREKGREVFKKAESASTPKEGKNGGRISKGDIYLRTDKGERKATGSYYTPDYIVKYIVEGTLEPIIKEIEKRGLKGKDLMQEILSIKVLDPAMGSGHFLVEATSFLATRIVEALAGMDEDIESIPLEDVLWARREIARRCIYGVDLNPLAVELSKVSLWLHTVTKDKPLSFLDHHLKCGNSLVGSNLSELAWYPLQSREKMTQKLANVDLEGSKPFIGKFLTTIDRLDSTPDETLQQVKEKERIFEELKETKEYQKIKAISDVRTSSYFGNEIEERHYYDFLNHVFYGSQKEWLEDREKEWFKKAQSISNEMSFFHWELEFPEVFFDKDRYKKNPGFDAVIGNPPYVRAENADKLQRRFLMKSDRYSTLYGRFDLYAVFLELGLKLCKGDARTSFILPSAVLSIDYATKIRQLLLESKTVESIVDLRGIEVFENVGIACCIIIVLNKIPPVSHLISYESQESRDKEIHRIHQNPQVHFLSFPNYIIKIELKPELFPLKERIERNSQLLGKLCYCITGVVAHDSETGESKDRLIHDKKIDNTCKPYIEAKEWEGRYSTIRSKRFIEYKPELMHRPKFEELFDSPKILIQGISKGDFIPATLDRSRVYCNHSLNCCVKLEDVIHHGSKLHLDDPDVTPDPRYSLAFVLAIMNSRLSGFYHSHFISNDLGIFPETVRKLPLPIISFTEDGQDREREFAKLKEIYENENLGNLFDYDRSLIEKKSGSIHDFLAFLAMRMIDYHDSIQREMEAFLDWMQSPVGLGIEMVALKNMKKFERFFDYPSLGSEEGLKELEKILAVNKVKMDLSKHARFKDQYMRASGNILRMKSRIGTTDLIIDHIVYRLFDLTADEIALIESIDKDEIKKKYGF